MEIGSSIVPDYLTKIRSQQQHSFDTLEILSDHSIKSSWHQINSLGDHNSNFTAIWMPFKKTVVSSPVHFQLINYWGIMAFTLPILLSPCLLLLFFSSLSSPLNQPLHSKDGDENCQAGSVCVQETKPAR